MSPTGRFWAVLGVILVVAFALRAAYVVTVTQHDRNFYDALYYDLQARTVAEGQWFANPLLGVAEPLPEAADHPPLTALTIAPAWLVFGSADYDGATLAGRFTMVLLGLGVVALVGVLGRRLAGDTAGLLAAGIAAVYPNLFMNDGLLMSETLASLTTAAAVLLAYRVMRAPGWGGLVGLGAICGLATLTRAELILLVPALAVPAAIVGAGRHWPTRLRAAGVTVAATVLLVAPWIGYNLSRFEEPALLSTGDGAALLGANCRSMWFKGAIGFWDPRCIPPNVPSDELDASVLSARYRDRAFDYASAHLDRAPVVALARLGRVLNVYAPGETASLNTAEGRPEWATYWGMAMFFVLVPLAVLGAVMLRRRKTRIWPLVVPMALVLLSGVAFYGQPRFRAPAEPMLVALAAVGVSVLVARRSGLPSASCDCATATPRSGSAPSS